MTNHALDVPRCAVCFQPLTVREIRGMYVVCSGCDRQRHADLVLRSIRRPDARLHTHA